MTNSLPTIPQQQLLLDVSRPAYYHIQYLIAQVWAKASQNWHISVGRVGYCRNHIVSWYLVRPTELSFDPVLAKVVESPTQLRNLERAITRVRRALVGRLRNVDFSSLTIRELRETLSFYYRSMRNLYRYSGFLRCLDHALQQKLEELLAGCTERDELVRLITLGKRPSFSREEYAKTLKLAMKMKEQNLELNDPMVQQAIEELVEQYCWMTGGQANTREYIYASLSKVLRHDPADLLGEELEQRERDLRRRREIVRQLGPEVRRYVRIASRAVWLKEYCKYSKNKTLYFSGHLFDEVAKRVNRDAGFVKDLLPDELYRLLEGDDVDDLLVEERVKCNVLYAGDRRVGSHIGKAAQAWADINLPKVGDYSSMLHGRVVSRGRVEGRAVIVRGREDFSKVQSGDILVVTNTTPNYIPVIQKSAGIIAEEGGLTSHVAVLSREFGIPCIVGVPNATSLLRGGQMIVLDANTGSAYTTS